MSAFVQETQWCGFLSLFHYSSEIKACRRPVFNSLVYPHGRCLTWSSSNCRFVTALSKKRPSDCTVDMQQMLSTGCRHLWFWRSRVCASGIRTLKCLQNFYFLSSRCPAPAMPQQGRSPSPKTPTLSGHGFLVLAQSWPLPIPTAEPDIWCCSSAPSCPACGWTVGSNFNPHGYSTLAVTLLCVLSKPSTDFAFKTKFH